MTAADWAAAEQEYILGGISQRALAKKYGCSAGRLAAYSKEHDWVSKRERNMSKIVQEAVDADRQLCIDTMTILRTTAKNMAQRLADAVESGEIGIDAYRDTSLTMRSLSELIKCPTQADLDEQQARIDKLRKDAAGEDKVAGVEISIRGWEDTWAQ